MDTSKHAAAHWERPCERNQQPQSHQKLSQTYCFHRICCPSPRNLSELPGTPQLLPSSSSCFQYHHFSTQPSAREIFLKHKLCPFQGLPARSEPPRWPQRPCTTYRSIPWAPLDHSFPPKLPTFHAWHVLPPAPLSLSRPGSNVTSWVRPHRPCPEGILSHAHMPYLTPFPAHFSLDCTATSAIIYILAVYLIH